MKKISWLAAFTVLVLVPFFLIAFKMTANKRPNILLIVSEDHGPHLSCYGDKVIKTPNLDQIAKNGFQFNNAYVTESVCSPSRSSILTGLYPHQSGHLGLATQGYHYVGQIKTIYEILKKGGYRTGMIGKLHIQPDSIFPIDYHPIVSPNYEKLDLARYANYADKFINAGDEPFFLMMNYPDAHWPFQDVVEGRPRQPIKPAQVIPFNYLPFDNERIRQYTTAIYNCLLRLDECVGELMAKLKGSGKEDNTLVIYLSDHGDEMARGKFDIYEASNKVPFLVSWPGKIKKGVQSGALVSSVDIVPTILDVAGLTGTDKRVTGKSLLPLFNNPARPFRQYLFTEKNCDETDLYNPRRAIRDSRYKLIYSLLPGKNIVAVKYMANNHGAALAGSPTMQEIETATPAVKNTYKEWLNPAQLQLYDLQNDPWEFKDLSAEAKYNSIKTRLFNELVKWQQHTDDPLRFPEKLKMLSQENDTMKVSPKMVWRYPQYLYGR